MWVEKEQSPLLERGRIRKEQVNDIILPSDIYLSLKDIAKQLSTLFILGAIIQ